MTSNTNRILFVLLLVQGALIMGMRFSGEQKLQLRSRKVLENFDPEKVTQIEILGAPKDKADGPPQNSVALSKVGATWGLANSDNYPANKDKIDEFLKKLGKLKSHTVVLRKSTYHPKLEVSKDKFQRQISITHDGKPMKFFVGSSPSFKNVHFRMDGEDEVLLVNDFSTSDVGDRAWSWVDREYLKFKKDDVWSLKLKNKKGAIDLEKNPQDSNWVSPNISKPLKKSTVDELVQKASAINLETPVGKTEKPEYGLQDPLATVTLVTGTSTVSGNPPPSTQIHTIRVGKKLEKENRYYVKASNSEYVVQVAGWAISPLVEKTKADLIDEPKADKKKGKK